MAVSRSLKISGANAGIWDWDLASGRLEQVMDVMAHSIEAPRANAVTRDMVALVGDCHLQTLVPSQRSRQGNALSVHR